MPVFKNKKRTLQVKLCRKLSDFDQDIFSKWLKQTNILRYPTFRVIFQHEKLTFTANATSVL